MSSMDPKKPALHPKKQAAAPRRVWRMTADAPQGEVLELVPKTTPPADAAAVRKAVAETGGEAQAKVLDPAKVPSWQASSWDLMTGLRVRDVSDTIPDRIFDELFGSPQQPLPSAPPPRRR
jgi:hypothetical protein